MSTPTPDVTEREKFEAWPFFAKMNDAAREYAWRAWQARASLPFPEMVTRQQMIAAIDAERHACSIVVWMVGVEACEPDADDLGLAGWFAVAEQRIKNRALRSAEAEAEREAQSAKPQRSTLRGFGVTITPGGARNWYCDADGVKRWVNNDRPCDEHEDAKPW